MSMEGTKADEIALVLEDDIVSGRIDAGTVLRQEQLSDRFEVSRTPIREALRRLAAHGLVSFVPNRGVRVRTLSREELREAFLVRAGLESLATELAVPRMTPERLAELDAAEQRFSELGGHVAEEGANRRRGQCARGGVDACQLRLPRRHLCGRRHAVPRAAREERTADVRRSDHAWVARAELDRLYERNDREHAPSARRSPRAALGARGCWPASTCSTRGSCSTRSSITCAAASRHSARPRRLSEGSRQPLRIVCSGSSVSRSCAESGTCTASACGTAVRKRSTAPRPCSPPARSPEVTSKTGRPVLPTAGSCSVGRPIMTPWSAAAAASGDAATTSCPSSSRIPASARSSSTGRHVALPLLHRRQKGGPVGKAETSLHGAGLVDPLLEALAVVGHIFVTGVEENERRELLLVPSG